MPLDIYQAQYVLTKKYDLDSTPVKDWLESEE